jgi:hypothetical protein
VIVAPGDRVLASTFVIPIRPAPSRRARPAATAVRVRGPETARRSVGRAAIGLVLAALVGGCGLVSTTPPAPTPADFAGIAANLAAHGIGVSNVVSGDPGCDDRTLAPEAIRFIAHGRDQKEPVTVYLYIFRNRDAFERRRTDVDACARSYVSDPDTFASVETSPYALVGQGPWAPEFATAVRAGLTQSAGTGD